MHTANYWIKRLKLKRHPEGGYYKEVYRSDEIISAHFLPKRYQNDRNMATSIYFLLKGHDISNFHKIQSDETWHYYIGTALELFILKENGQLTRFLLGQNLENEEHLQITVPRNHWFGARLVDTQSYALVGCTVAPGFHFDDFELADRAKLIAAFPRHVDLIEKLTC